MSRIHRVGLTIAGLGHPHGGRRPRSSRATWQHPDRGRGADAHPDRRDRRADGCGNGDPEP